MSKLEKELKAVVNRVFEKKRQKLGVDGVKLDVEIAEEVGGPPVVGENVYGEAFPKEKPPRVWIQAWPEATDREITKGVCDELLHIKYPELRQYDEHGHETKKFKQKLEACVR